MGYGNGSIAHKLRMDFTIRMDGMCDTVFLSRHRVGSCVMILTATVLNWISQEVESPAVPPALEHGCPHLSPIRGLHRCPTQDLHRLPDTSKDLQLPFGEQPSQAYTYLSVQYITVVMRDHNNYTQTMTSRLVRLLSGKPSSDDIRHLS